MKKSIFIIAALAAMAAGCAKPEFNDVTEENSNIMNLVVTGYAASDMKTPFSSEVNSDKREVMVMVPYYLSDTEPIQADLTKMKIEASLPQGCTFEPSLAGVHDLVAGFKSTLVYSSGKREEYTFKAMYFKSSAAMLQRMKFEDDSVQEAISVKQPASEGENGVITVPRNDDTVEALERVIVMASPWSTVVCSAWNEEEKILDLGKGAEITIIAQNGEARTTYTVEFKDPVRVDYGVGQIYCLFAWQATTDNAHGMTCSDNRTIAVVGKQLILSNAYDYTKMPVYNRMTGEYLGNNIVNTTGIDPEDIIHAITQDDAGHMVAATYVCNFDDVYRTPSKTLQERIYVWKDGIENEPVKIFDEDFLGPVFDRAPVGVNLNANVTGQDCFHVIDVAGDMLSGDAVLTTSSRINSRPVFLFFKDGEFVGKDGNGKADVTFHSIFGSGSNYSMWVSTKVVVMDPQAKEYFHQSGNTRHNICYSNEQIGMRFETPKEHWWAASGSTNPLRGMDVVDFNGARILAVQNALSIYDGGKVAQFPVETERTSKDTYTHRLAVRTYVADVTMNPNENGLISGFLFDTRTGRVAEGDIPGTGNSPSGMTSSYSFTSGSVVGSNWPEAGDVVLFKDPRGNSVQMYSLTPGQGLIAYNLTNLEP